MSGLKLPPVTFGNETLGQRPARIRREHGFMQNEIAERTGAWDHGLKRAARTR